MIAEARFYDDLSIMLLEGAARALEKAGASHEIIQVPGALELPGAIAIAARTDRFDGYVALGCIIRGETYHFDIVANESARGIMDLTMREHLAIGNGILTCENYDQAEERADISRLDKGGGAARAALALIDIKRKYES